jgi:diguanylate cyclase (GGDEF)-like protein
MTPVPLLAPEPGSSPPDAHVQALRLRRQWLGLASYLMFLLPLAYCTHFGYTRFGYRGLAAFGAIAVVINAMFFLLIRGGWSRRFADPSLTFAQVATAAVLALAMVHNLTLARGPFLMLFYTIFFFGLFGLTTRQFLVLAIGTAGGYAAMVAWEFRALPPTADELHLEILRILVLAVILLWMSLVGGYVTGLRTRLAQRKAALSVALGKLAEQASRDELTGAYNRRHLLEIMAHERERTRRHSHPFSVCILDIDHFKRFNDEHGHQVGDEVLKGFADRLSAQARKLDWLGRQDPDHVFGRFGGEEFLLVLPQTGAAGAVRCIERLREGVHATAFDTSAGPMHIAFSAGAAEFRREESLEQLLARADAALYRAKAGGRNRTEFAGDDTPAAA